VCPAHCQSGLSNPGSSGDRRDHDWSGRHVDQQVVEGAQSDAATGERGHLSGQFSGRGLGGAGRGGTSAVTVKLRIAVEDRVMQRLQRVAWLRPEIVPEHLPDVAVGGQCVGQPPGAIQSKHQRAVQMSLGTGIEGLGRSAWGSVH
jgi:hypothetical protein